MTDYEAALARSTIGTWLSMAGLFESFRSLIAKPMTDSELRDAVGEMIGVCDEHAHACREHASQLRMELN